MALLDDVKLALRISSSAFDSEVQDLIDAAKLDLKLSGVTSEKADAATPDALIKRAIVTYAKANFGFDNPDADRLQQSYDMLKAHLTLSREYIGYAITFTVTDGANPLENATVKFNGEEKITNAAGQAVFYGVQAEQNLTYSVKLDGYEDVTGEVDVSGSATVIVTMEAV